jgi:uncharacterized protein
MSLGERVAKLSGRFYDRMRDPAASTVGSGEATVSGFDALRGRKYCVLVSYRRSGEGVPTPVWFGLGGDGRLYVRTEADAGKVKRIRANPHVRVAPSTSRGRPTGPVADGVARILAAPEAAGAERALRSNYGLGRQLYEATFGRAAGAAYLEVTPAGVEESGSRTEATAV